MNRRPILATIFASMTFPGCIDNSTERNGIKLLEVSNNVSTQLTVDITIEADGEPKYESDYNISAGSELEISKEWMTQPADYVITVSIPQEATVNLSTADLSSGSNIEDEDCYLFDFVIDSVDKIRPHARIEPCTE